MSHFDNAMQPAGFSQEAHTALQQQAMSMPDPRQPGPNTVPPILAASDIALLLLLFINIEPPGDHEFSHHRLHQAGLLRGATTVTDKGKVYCEAICSLPLPLPVQQWRMPE